MIIRSLPLGRADGAFGPQVGPSALLPRPGLPSVFARASGIVAGPRDLVAAPVAVRAASPMEALSTGFAPAQAARVTQEAQAQVARANATAVAARADANRARAEANAARAERDALVRQAQSQLDALDRENSQLKALLARLQQSAQPAPRYAPMAQPQMAPAAITRFVTAAPQEAEPEAIEAEYVPAEQVYEEAVYEEQAPEPNASDSISSGESYRGLFGDD